MFTTILSPTIGKFFAQHADFVAGIVVATLSVFVIIFPRAIPFFYFALALMAAIEIWRTGTRNQVLKSPGTSWILFGLFICWCFVTILWSKAPLQALSKVLFLASIAVAAYTISAWLTSISSSMSKYLKLGLLIGFTMGTIFLTIETVFDQVITLTILNEFKFARPDGLKHKIIVNNEINRMALDTLNRNIATLNMLLWPAILTATSQLIPKWNWVIASMLVSLVILATFHSVHETSMLAMLAGAVFFSLAYFAPRAARIIMMVVWVSSVVLVIPMSLKAYEANFHKAEWMPESAQARIVLWYNTARRYLDTPILGVGVRTTQFIDDARNKKANKPKRHHYNNIGTARHSHNIYMQTWYELGAVGSLLLLLAGLAVLTKINQMSTQIVPYVMATFGVAVTIAGFTWGMWQVWYIAMFAYGAAAMLIACRQI